jgi:hypothetical protein
MAIDIIVLAKKFKFTLHKMSANFPVYIVLAFSGMIFLTLLFFAGYHGYLIAFGRTTNEEQRGKYRKYKGNPFNRGVRKNCSIFWSYKKSRIFDSE